MNLTLLLSIFGIVFTLFLAVMSIFLFLQIKNERRIKRAELVVMSSQREKLEEMLAAQTRKYIDSSERFEELNKLLLYKNDVPSLADNVRNDSFFESLGININKMKVVPNQVMCVMPITKNTEKLYGAIRDVCVPLGLQAIRTDDIYEPNSLMGYIVRSILQSKYLIVSLDARNINVAFEMGIAQSLGKPILRIVSADNLRNLSFDTQSDRLIIYKGINDLQIKLNKALQSLRKTYPLLDDVQGTNLIKVKGITTDFKEFVNSIEDLSYREIYDMHETVSGKVSPFNKFKLILAYQGTKDSILVYSNSHEIMLRLSPDRRKEFILWIERNLMHGMDAERYYGWEFDMEHNKD